MTATIQIKPNLPDFLSGVNLVEVFTGSLKGSKFGIIRTYLDIL